MTRCPVLSRHFVLMSRKPGIGYCYVNTHKSYHKNGLKAYTRVHGHYGSLPRYYKDKFFNELERKRIGLRNKRLADEAFEKQIQELSKHHSDPYLYYEQCQQQAHNKIAQVAKSKSKI